MGEWFWIRFEEGDEWQPARLAERERYYPADENGWFDAEEIWEIGPPVACPDALIEAEKPVRSRLSKPVIASLVTTAAIIASMAALMTAAACAVVAFLMWDWPGLLFVRAVAVLSLFVCILAAATDD